MSEGKGVAGLVVAGIVGLSCAGVALGREHAPAEPRAVATPAPTAPVATSAVHGGFPWTATVIAVVAALAVIAAAAAVWRWARGRHHGRVIAVLPERRALPAAPQRAIERGPVPLSEALPGWSGRKA